METKTAPVGDATRPVEISKLRAWWICLLVATAIYGIPVIVGSTWLPTPGFPARTDQSRHPKYQVGYDSFSFPQFELPYRELARQSLAQGELPLWNPYSALGLPIAAQYENQVFSPLEWLDLALNDNRVWNLTLLLRIAFAGWGAFLFLRRPTGDDLTALSAGLIYMVTSFFVGFQSMAGFLNGAVLLPWLMLAIDRAFTTGGWAGSISLVGGAFGLAAVTGQPQIALINFGAAAVYGFMLFLTTAGSGRWRGLLLVLLGGICAAAAAAPQLLAFHEGLATGYTIHSQNNYSGGGTSPLNLMIVFMPMLLGPIMSPWLPRLFPAELNHEGYPVLLGAGLTVLLLLGLLRSLLPSPTLAWRQRLPLWWGAVILCACITIVVVNTFGWGNLWSHPAVAKINLPRYSGPLVSFAAALLAAGALRDAHRLPRWAIGLAAGGAVGAVVWLHVQAWPLLTAAAAETNVELRHVSILVAETTGWGTLTCLLGLLVLSRRNPIGAVCGGLILVLAELAFSVRFGFDARYETWRLVWWGLCVGAALACAGRRYRAAGAMLAVAHLVLLTLAWAAPNFLEKARNPFGESEPRLKFLRDRLGQGSVWGRLLTSQWVMTPNTLATHGINQMAGLNPVQPGLSARWLLKSVANKNVNYTIPVAWHGIYDGGDWPTWQDYRDNRLLYNFMGVRLLAETSQRELSGLNLPDLKLVWDTPEGRIWEDTRVWPRAFLARGSIIAAASNEEAQDSALLSRQREHFPHLAVTTSSSGWLEPYATGDTTLRMEGVARFDQRFTSALVEAVSAAPALLVVTDVWYPGWRAWLDGNEVPIWPVQGLVRGVHFPAGRHVVEFRYDPPWLKLSLLAMVAGWCLILLMGACALRQIRRASLA
ncbi:MAG: hypothetical protein EXS42_09725 [Lacunisphaera sp.]|nr:hypothetical protein [Lacunisphaera sp.]